MAAHSKKSKYIAQKLTKYFPRKFPTYTSALPDAKLVYAQIQDAGERVTLKTIFSKVRVKRVSKSEGINKLLALKEVQGMMKEVPYYHIDDEDYHKSISKLPNNLLLRSSLFPADVKQPLVGGGKYGYHQLFAPYVAFCDKQRIGEEDSTRYNIDWFVKWTKPVPDPDKKGFFIMEFVSIDANGDPTDYGFNPKDIKKQPEETTLSKGEAPAKGEEKLAPEVPEAKGEVAKNLTSDQEFILKLEAQKEKTAIAKAELIKEMKAAGAPWADIKTELDKL